MAISLRPSIGVKLLVTRPKDLIKLSYDYLVDGFVDNYQQLKAGMFFC